ncbi:hypothetical protein D3C80_523480 [compost metagenome]
MALHPRQPFDRRTRWQPMAGIIIGNGLDAAGRRGHALQTGHVLRARVLEVVKPPTALVLGWQYHFPDVPPGQLHRVGRP